MIYAIILTLEAAFLFGNNLDNKIRLEGRIMINQALLGYVGKGNEGGKDTNSEIMKRHQLRTLNYFEKTPA